MREYLDLPLHHGQAPRWLFERMQKLGYLISGYIIREEGTEGFLRRISHPLWFQGLGVVLGFDWHSSGLTTVLTGALKEALNRDKSLGIKVAGGKGRTSLKTPEQILNLGGNLRLVRTSKLVAKVDNSLIQDGFSLYHHTFFFDRRGHWTVVQQGMSSSGWARRYHWCFKVKNLLLEPHSGVISAKQRKKVLNLVHRQSQSTQKAIHYLACKPQVALKVAQSPPSALPREHALTIHQLSQDCLKKVLLTSYERQPSSFKDFLLLRGVGPKTIRALALISDLIFNTNPSYEDVKTYSFAVGGKDGYPYPVDRQVYDKVIAILQRDIERAKMSPYLRDSLLRRIKAFYG
ncbi:DUF763 domain-containing protein [bacterium]|nr:DUF763 domain-containing protein [bacterium]